MDERRTHAASVSIHTLGRGAGGVEEEGGIPQVECGNVLVDRVLACDVLGGQVEPEVADGGADGEIIDGAVGMDGLEGKGHGFRRGGGGEDGRCNEGESGLEHHVG